MRTRTLRQDRAIKLHSFTVLTCHLTLYSNISKFSTLYTATFPLMSLHYNNNYIIQCVSPRPNAVFPVITASTIIDGELNFETTAPYAARLTDYENIPGERRRRTPGLGLRTHHLLLRGVELSPQHEQELRIVAVIQCTCWLSSATARGPGPPELV